MRSSVRAPALRERAIQTAYATRSGPAARRRPSLFRLWQPIVMAAILALVGCFGVALARAQDDARAALRDRFQTRIDLTARFATAYDTDVLARESSAGFRRLGTFAPTETEFQSVLADFGFEAGALLDSNGRALQIYPAQTDLIGTVLTGDDDYLARAVSGVPAMSGVGTSAVRKIPVVAFAAPFETPYGRRVLSGAFAVSTTPLSTYLENALPYAGGEVDVVDASGLLASSNVVINRDIQSIDTVDPALGRAMDSGTSGRYERDGEWRWFTTSAVTGSSLTMVASVPETIFYLPLEGPAQWLPWMVILLFSVGSLYTVHVLFALHRSREDYLSLARVDQLTGVSNRRWLTVEADRMLKGARADGGSVAVLMIDLDRFKAVNDTLGHEAGDEVLRAVTARMRGALRGGDLLGRWGGEEFVALMPAISIMQAMQIAERVRAAISAAPIALNGGRSRTVTASVGCAITTDETIDEVLGRADGAMYGAKRSGDTVQAAPAPI